MTGPRRGDDRTSGGAGQTGRTDAEEGLIVPKLAPDETLELMKQLLEFAVRSPSQVPEINSGIRGLLADTRSRAEPQAEAGLLQPIPVPSGETEDEDEFRAVPAPPVIPAGTKKRCRVVMELTKGGLRKKAGTTFYSGAMPKAKVEECFLAAAEKALRSERGGEAPQPSDIKIRLYEFLKELPCKYVVFEYWATAGGEKDTGTFHKIALNKILVTLEDLAADWKRRSPSAYDGEGTLRALRRGDESRWWWAFLTNEATAKHPFQVRKVDDERRKDPAAELGERVGRLITSFLDKAGSVREREKLKTRLAAELVKKLPEDLSEGLMVALSSEVDEEQAAPLPSAAAIVLTVEEMQQELDQRAGKSFGSVKENRAQIKLIKGYLTASNLKLMYRDEDGNDRDVKLRLSVPRRSTAGSFQLRTTGSKPQLLYSDPLWPPLTAASLQ